MKNDKHHDPQVCQLFHQAIEVIGRRWTGAILRVAGVRPLRFCEFKEAIPELSDRLLTERLKELEEVGLIVREVSTGRPVQVTYRLTPKGEELQPIFCAIGEWAGRWHELEAAAEPAGA
jgi:DNA-binding HxlR family transcriptional regulator